MPPKKEVPECFSLKSPLLLIQEAANILSLVVSSAKGIMSLVNKLHGEMQ